MLSGALSFCRGGRASYCYSILLQPLIVLAGVPSTPPLCVVLVGAGASLPPWTPHVPEPPFPPVCKEAGSSWIPLPPARHSSRGLSCFLVKAPSLPFLPDSPVVYQQVPFTLNWPETFYYACDQRHWESQYLFVEKTMIIFSKIILIL